MDVLEEYRWEENSVLPLAVLMKIEFTDGTAEQWLRRVAGISKNSTFGVRESSESTSSSSGTSSASGGASGGGRSR